MKFKKINSMSKITLYVLATFFLSCTTNNDQARDSSFLIQKEPENKAARSITQDKLSELDSIAGSGWAADQVKDIRLILNSEIKQKSGLSHEAARLLFEAMQHADGFFAKEVFERWVVSYSNTVEQKIDRLILAKLLLAESRNGNASRYMLAKGLTTETALIEALDKIIPDKLLPSDASNFDDTIVPIGIPANDPLLVSTSLAVCKRRTNTSSAKWSKWERSLGPEIRSYWLGLVQQCSNRSSEALENFKYLSNRLSKSVATHSLAVEATSRIATLERKLDQKIKAADTYLKLMDFYNLPGVSAKSMGLDELSFLIRRIQDTLWAARYRATVADYENAKRFCQLALELNREAIKLPTALTQEKRQELSDLQADTYHTLAFRIAIENNNYDTAIAINKLALAIPYISNDWSERLLWSSGFYEFLAGNAQVALKNWEQLLQQSNNEPTQAMVKFWIARVLQKSGKTKESINIVNSIVDDHTLSFYSVVAPKLAGFTGFKDWREIFGGPTNLINRLHKPRPYNLRSLRSKPHLARLLVRAEILVAAAGLHDLASLALRELEDAMLKKLDIKIDQDAFVYLSRLQYNAGQFLSSISITTKMLKSSSTFWRDYPEQILIYFPRPYRDAYRENAIQTSLESELLLGISRQESGFTASIQSSANAVGIMQLIRPTAKKFIQEANANDELLEKLLVNPRENIQIGSSFLKHLTNVFNGYAPAIYGAYNAGEYSMRTWLERRSSNDPLVFVELVPFGETKDYIKHVWRNVSVYNYVNQIGHHSARPKLDTSWRRAEIPKGSGRWTL